MDDVGSVKNDLRTAHYDLVLTNLAEAPIFRNKSNLSLQTTRVVPVLFKQPKLKQKAATKQYKVIVNNPKDGLDFLIAVRE